MRYLLMLLLSLQISLPLIGEVTESILPAMDGVYGQDFGRKINAQQREAMHQARADQPAKLRVMTYNMLYNVQEAEDKLPPKHRWASRKPRLIEYLAFANADLIGSQELQEDQVQEIMRVLGDTYAYYGEKTRENEGRGDMNVIFFKKSRLELIDSQMVPYHDPHYQNAFTSCTFRDKLQGQEFIALNTKLTWGDADRRLAEATQLNQFTIGLDPKKPVIALGDFNTFPFIQNKNNLFFDGDAVERALAGQNLQDAKTKSIFGHFGPLCSITNSKDTLEPFSGAELPGFILDHVFSNQYVKVLTHGIDPARVEGEFPSDHFPVITDLVFKI